jgi:hypothetical protein
VVTSLSSLQYGFSHKILREFTARDTNEIIMIEKPNKVSESVAAKIFQNQKKLHLTETTLTVHNQKPVTFIAPIIQRKHSIEEVISETILRKEASTIAEN